MFKYIRKLFSWLLTREIASEPVTKKDVIWLVDMLSNQYVCKDIFLYPGYNYGEKCPQCGEIPNRSMSTDPEDIKFFKCHCYDDAIKRFHERKP